MVDAIGRRADMPNGAGNARGQHDAFVSADRTGDVTGAVRPTGPGWPLGVIDTSRPVLS